MSAERSTFKHTYELKPRFKDYDVYKHVNNAVYATFMEEARGHYIQDVLGDDIDWIKQSIILANSNINFLSPIELREKIRIMSACTHIGTKSFKIEHEFYAFNHNGERLCSRSSSVLVCFDYTAGSSISIPEVWRKKFEEFEGKLF